MPSSVNTPVSVFLWYDAVAPVRVTPALTEWENASTTRPVTVPPRIIGTSTVDTAATVTVTWSLSRPYEDPSASTTYVPGWTLVKTALPVASASIGCQAPVWPVSSDRLTLIGSVGDTATPEGMWSCTVRS